MNPYFVIVFAGIVVYLQSLFFAFTYLDDNVLILDNLFFLKNLGNIFNSFTQEVFHVLHASAAYYRPILTISYMLDAQIAGGNPFFYHLTSVLIHLINSCLLFIFLQKLKVKRDLSLIFSLVFAVHPVLSQAVSWIPGRNDSLLFLFVLGSFIFLIDFLQTKKLKTLFLHLIFFFLSVFTKESSLFLPVIIVYFGIFLAKKKEFLKILPILSLSWILIFIFWFALRSIALGNNPVSYKLGDSLVAVIKNFPAVFLFVGKILFPVNLSVLPTLVDSTLIYGIISLLLLCLLVVFSKKKNIALMFFGLFWFFIFLLPGFIRPDSSYMPDFIEHRIYLPIVGLFLVFSEISFIKNIDLRKTYVKAAVVLILVVLSLLNIFYSRVFKDQLSFWRNAVATSPSHPLSHKNLGAMYYLGGDYENAEKEYLKALKLSPTESMIHNNLGLIYFNKKDYKKAEEEYFKELSLYPNYDNAYSNLALLYYSVGEKAKAKDMWLKTLSINPDHKEALRGLAIYYLKDEKNNLKANYYYQEAVKREVQF